MRRWHQERDLMLRRWRQELAKHEGFPQMALAPPSLAPSIDCHCSHGIGSMRKRTPYGCGNPRCGICHWGKIFQPKNRAKERRDAIAYASD